MSNFLFLLLIGCIASPEVTCEEVYDIDSCHEEDVSFCYRSSNDLDMWFETSGGGKFECFHSETCYEPKENPDIFVCGEVINCKDSKEELINYCLDQEQ